jgi:hypothetical protein
MLVAWSLVLPPPTIAQQREPLSVGSVTAVPGTAASGYIRVAPAAGDNGTAVVTDWLGEQISVIVSPNDGVVMYQAVTPPISAGETVTAVGVPLTRAASR